MKKQRNKFWLLTIIPIGVILDQVTKLIAENILSQTGEITIIENFFSFHLAYNTGAAWGLFAGARWFLIGSPILIILVALVVFWKSKKYFFNLGLVVVLTGALGNLIDRIFIGHVVDFLDFLIFNYDFPVFNVADMFITLGSIYLAIYLIFEKEEKKENG